MDNNSIYVREKGKLRCVSGIVLSQHKSVSSCRRTNPFVVKKEHFIFTYNTEGSLRYSTKSLFELTLRFVADNIHHVDSLVGFPEQIGDKLFAAAEENRVFSNPDISCKALQLFSDAYGHMVLESLCLRNRFPLLHEKMDEIKTFHGLKCLDLFGCRLGDDHEMFQHLTSTSLANLTHLAIGGNNLSDVGLQRLTAPIRIMKKGLGGLQLLDISHNPISEKALRYLRCLPKLEQLDVSGTLLKPGADLKIRIRNLLGFVFSEKPLDVFDHSKCKTEGWAEQWETNSLKMPKLKKVDPSRTSSQRFFGRQKFVREVLNTSPLIHDSQDDVTKDCLHFFKPAAYNQKNSDQSPAEKKVIGSCHGVRKRKRELETLDKSHLGPSSSSFSAEDIVLLNSY
ncbi:leucine-rich repeat-containing protein 42 isoform X2 [Cynoglossus semilaevis]|uniref:leucine-rich repeat-containing protein 42 isoform X2 n=1 Tax=Cynoglossus semilaevis TaxID=244447 RepID=UPI000D62CBCF|nr:leucine-rich repeat-containing protein 42 isoform X2 [Cynoglossus semilaevis]